MPVWKDVLFLAAERLARQLYWSWPWLRRRRRRRGKNEPVPVQQCRREALASYLNDIGMKNGALVMVHTGISGLEILSEGESVTTNAVSQARKLLDDFLSLIGPDGTLVMPTNALYQSQDLELKAAQPTLYDPCRTPCGVGLVNEFFWRRKGVKRSLFPFNMLAASGPLADELLRDNLNDRKPSPHGPDSGYYRICRRNGLVVSVGVPLREYLTLAHVVEEVRSDWPIKDFFMDRCYRIVQNGTVTEWTIRLRREEYAKFCYCRKKMGRDLVAEGLIHEGRVGTVTVDWARAGEVYDFFWRKTAKKPYPYYGLWMMKPWKQKS